MPSIHPGIFLIIAGIISAVVPKRVRQVLLIACSSLAFLFALNLRPGTEMTLSFFRHYEFHYIHVTQQNFIFLFIFSLMGIVAGIYALHECTPLNCFAAMGYLGSSLGVTLAGDWVTLLIFWEVMAVTSMFLIFANGSARSTKAGIRYLIMHMLSGNAMLFGVAIKVHQGSLLIENITANHDLAFWLLFLGVAINCAMVPLHAWVPDAYPESTMSGNVYMCFLTTKVSILCLLQVFAGFHFLEIMGIIMIYYGAVFAMMENDMRRLLSYHIISQLGYMVFDAGVGEHMGFNASAAIAYGNIIYKSVLFMCVGAIIYATGIRKINQLGSIGKKFPLICGTFFIAAYSIAGFPPLAGFTCKSLSIVAAEETGSLLLVVILMAGSVLTALSIPFKMGYFIFFGDKKEYPDTKPIPKNMTIAMVCGAAICVFTGLFPQITYKLMPFAMDYHPYYLGHILEYVQLLPAALIPFLIFLDIMKPHDRITLDTDWFVRKPLRWLIYALSSLVCFIQTACAGCGRKLYHAFQLATNDPYRLVGKKPVNTVSKKDEHAHFLEDSYRMQIGSGMLFVIAMIIIVGLFILIKH